jgi:hypothetical protein
MRKFLATIFCFLSIAIAQQHVHSSVEDYVRCMSDELERELQVNNPEFIEERDALIAQSKSLIENNPQWRTARSTIYIPVIFHVLYFDQSDNLAKDKIAANFDQINLDFQNLNPDGDEIPSDPNPSNAPYDPGIDYAFNAVRGSMQVKFVGAQGERTGDELIEGVSIRRYNISSSTVSGVAQASSLASNTSTDSGAPGGYQNGYLNIYIAPLGGNLLGQAYLGFPESVVITESVGSLENPGTISGYNRGRTLTHELGHNFTFPHTFSASNCGSPVWNDVPAQIENNRDAQIYEWPASSGDFYGRRGINSCINVTGKGDQFMNYMDYSFDDQMRMFSEEQALEGYAWAAARNWEEVVEGINVTLSSSVSYATSADGFSINVNFAESVTGFTQDDINVSNGTIVSFNSSDGRSYSFDIEAISDGEVEVYIPENSVIGDSSGFNNFESNRISILVDRENPIAGTFSIDNLEDSQYIVKNGNVKLTLSNFDDSTTGIANYYVSIGLSPSTKEIIADQPFSTNNIQLSNLLLADYQQYYINIYATDQVGLSSDVVSKTFYFFGSLLGDTNGDWVIDFDDYKAFIAGYPGIDIAPVTGSMPYLFPNFDGVSDEKDANQFKALWLWSLEENGLSTPNYTVQGTNPFLRILNDQLILRFPDESESIQVYFEYNPDRYLINFQPSNILNEMVLSASSSETGVAHVEIGNLNPTSETKRNEVNFNFENLSDTYEFIKVSYAAYDNNNSLLSEGYNLIQTAPSTYRLGQSYPNPFRESGTTIEFDLTTTARITMVIIDIRGRIVRTLIDNEEKFGYQSVLWDAKNDNGDTVSSGVYFYQIQSDVFNSVGKLLFVK